MKPENGTIVSRNGVEFRYQDGVWYPTKSKGWTANATIASELMQKWEAGDYKVWDQSQEKYVDGVSKKTGIKAVEKAATNLIDASKVKPVDAENASDKPVPPKAKTALAEKALSGEGVSNPTPREVQTEVGITTASPKTALAGMTTDPQLKNQLEPAYYSRQGLKGLFGGLGDKIGDTGKIGEYASYLPDVFKFALGMKGANEKLPEFEVPSQFTDYENRMRELSYQGLTDAELATGRRDLERSYAYDVNSIKDLAGGRPGVALANLGRAASSYQGGLNALNVADAQMQRNNLLNYGGVVNARVGLEQNAFNLKYQNAMQNKMAGAQLAADALSNIQSRSDYNKAYGEGSIYDQYQKSLLEGQNYQNEILKYQLENPLDINSIQISPNVINPNAQIPNYYNQYYGQ